jgi:hypothetical protein
VFAIGHSGIRYILKKQKKGDHGMPKKKKTNAAFFGSTKDGTKIKRETGPDRRNHPLNSGTVLRRPRTMQRLSGSPADLKINSPAVIDPDAPVMRAPTVAFGAGGFTTLIHQLGSAPDPFAEQCWRLSSSDEHEMVALRCVE